MKIITITKEEFEEYSNKHKYNSFYQSPEYADFSIKNDGFNIHYLGFTDDGDNLIGASLMLYKTLFWGYKYAYAPRGMLFDYENSALVNELTIKLIKLLKKQKFIFITIDPPIVASERDKAGNTLKFNNNVNDILKCFKKNGYEHLGFNLYDESILPRWNVLAPLNKDSRIMLNSFDDDIKEKISYTNSIGMKTYSDENLDINNFYEFIKKKYGKKSIKYFQNLISSFNGRAKIFYAILDTQKYTLNANKLYEKEEEKNNNLAEIIQSGDTVKYNIQKAINDKMVSDRLLHAYKKDVVASTKLLKSNPDGLTLAASLVIEEAKGVNILLNYADEAYERYNAHTLLTYEIMKYYGKENYKYINLGSITGNFNSGSKYYPALINKLGFNSSILEYIGEFNIILNSTMYKIYLKKYKKEKKS